MGIILLIIALILEVLLTVPSIIFAIFRTVFKRGKGISKLNQYFLDLAVSVDMLGNVTAAPLLNLACIKSDGYQFGNTRETVSLVLAINSKRKKLSIFGIWLGNLLNFLDRNHLNKTLYYHTRYINSFKISDKAEPYTNINRVGFNK